MSLPWRRDSWDPQILQSKFMTGLTNLSRSSVIQTESGFFSRFTDAEVSSGGIESRWDQIFRNCPDRPWCPPSLMWNWHWVSFPGTRRPERSHLRLASRLRKSRAIPLLHLRLLVLGWILRNIKFIPCQIQYPVSELLWIQIGHVQDRKIAFRLYDVYIYLFVDVQDTVTILDYVLWN